MICKWIGCAAGKVPPMHRGLYQFSTEEKMTHPAGHVRTDITFGDYFWTENTIQAAGIWDDTVQKNSGLNGKNTTIANQQLSTGV